MDVCSKCGKRKLYYRSAFASWKCYNCGIEIKNENSYDFLRDVNHWWNTLSSEEKKFIYKYNNK
jgi:ribosomal protein L37AE/L43A